MMTWIFAILLTVSAFSQEQSFIRSFGSNSRPGPFDANEFSKSAVSYEDVDWRSVSGVNWTGPIRNQANCGACVAFSMIATIEDQLTISSGVLWKREAFSQEALFSCGRAKCSSGWFVLDAARVVEQIGVVDSACLPYSAGALGKVVACGNFCEEQDERTLKVKSTFKPKGAAEVKEALKKGPLVTSLTVHQGFDSYKGGIYKAKWTDPVLGGHAVELVGYNDKERYWIIKNSWGEDWGEKGYGRVSYDDISGVGAETVGFVIDGPAEGLELPLEDAYVQGDFQIKGKFSDVEVFKGNKSIKKLDCQDSCFINSKTLPDGEYALRTVSSSGRKVTRRITILNSAFVSTMDVRPGPGFNYDYPQNGRIYFDVSFAGPVFPEHLIIEILKGTQVVYRRDFPDVYAINHVGVNSISLANGRYDVQFKNRTLGREVTSSKIKITIEN